MKTMKTCKLKLTKFTKSLLAGMLVLSIMFGVIVLVKFVLKRSPETPSGALSGEADTNLLEEWGLGKKETEYVSLNRDYDWYVGQIHTGYASSNNSGSACAEMAGRWSNKAFSKTAEDVRDMFPNDGVNLYPAQIYEFLRDNEIPCRLAVDITEQTVKDFIDKNQILIVYYDTKYMMYNSNDEQHRDIFYTGDTGHYSIIKGYRVVDGKTYFEMYDPFNNDSLYSDGSYKGMDRYYLSSELIYAISDTAPWNFTYIVVSDQPNQLDKTEYVSLNRDYNWYVNQNLTGATSSMNCGPACAEMAGRWSNREFSKTVADALELFPNDGSGWDLACAYYFLKENGIPCRYLLDRPDEGLEESAVNDFVEVTDIILNHYAPEGTEIKAISSEEVEVKSISESEETVKEFINNGHILIVGYNLNPTSESSIGHFSIIKGYLVADGNTYFEMYDPNSRDSVNSDGINRYFLSSVLLEAINNWYPFYIAVSSSPE